MLNLFGYVGKNAYLCSTKKQQVMRFTALQLNLEQQKRAFKVTVDEIYKTVLEIVKRNGGEVDMSDEEADGAYSVEYTNGNEAVETRILAVRATEDGSLEIKTEYFAEEEGCEWESLRYGEHEFVKALMSIAENIFEYIPEEDDRSEP